MTAACFSHVLTTHEPGGWFLITRKISAPSCMPQNGNREGERAFFPRRRGHPAALLSGVREMLRWALIFLVVALVAAVFGFGGIASASAGIAQILFFLFLVLFVVSLVMGMMRRAP